MKNILLFIAVCIGSMAFSQPDTKMDFYLASKLQAYTQKKAEPNGMVPMLVRGNINAIKQMVQKNRGTFKYSYGNIAAIVIPVSALTEFNESGSVDRMEGAPHHMHFTDDSSNVKNHIIQILDGQTPLPQAYQGKGVVLGFIDTGIDYLHSDFRDSSGTRVKFYWDQNRYMNKYTPAKYGYGQAWNKAQLDASSGYTDPNDSASIIDGGHGSTVAGAACGNGKCDGHQFGGCPKADIIFVAFNFNSTDPSALTDAVDYIYTCADSLNEPCVINASLGNYDGSHDDSDLQGELIDSMINAKQPGRVFVAAAGNEGVPYHVHDSLKTGDTTFTWFVYDGGMGIADIPIFANETDFNNIKFKIRCDKVQTGSFEERDNITVYSDISNLMGMNTTNVYNGYGQRLGVITSYGQIYGKGSYSLEFQIAPDSTSYLWGFQATGTGRFDIWDYGTFNGVQDTDGLGINPTLYPEIKKYKQPDTLETICSSYQCSPYVITTQTYFNSRSFVDCDGNTQTNANPKDIPGAFVWTTSKGPTRNYVHMKPDISASGNYTLAADPTWLTSCGSGTDLDSCHAIDGGTSMASPMVASAAALYLNRYPSATSSDIKHCIIESAYTDEFTGLASHLPNYNWGYGKLNAFNAITTCSPSGIPIVNSLTDASLSVYPNPYSINTVISYNFSEIKNYNNANIVVYNMLGKVVKTINLQGNQGSVNMDRANLASGMYFYSLVVDGIRLKTGKLEVM